MLAQPPEPTSDILDDIFGEPPPSGPNPSAPPRATEHSDIPRLRSTHATAGYRDGIATAKPRFVQAGFDEGYSLGGVLGFKAAWLLRAVQLLCPAPLDPVAQRARAELALENVFCERYFDGDGVWRYAVPGEEAGMDFERVGGAHPVVVEWVGRLEGLAEGKGVVLVPFDTQSGSNG